MSVRVKVWLDGRDLLGVQVTHVVPEALAGERRTGDGEEAAQHGALIPVGHPGLAGRSQAAVQSGEGEVGSDADSRSLLPAWRSMVATILNWRVRSYRAAGGYELPQGDFLGRGWLGGGL